MFFVSAVLLLQPPANATTNFERGKSRTNAQPMPGVRKRGEGSSTGIWYLFELDFTSQISFLLKIISSLSLFSKPTVTLALPVSNEFQHCAVTSYYMLFHCFRILLCIVPSSRRNATRTYWPRHGQSCSMSESESLCQRGVESAT